MTVTEIDLHLSSGFHVFVIPSDDLPSLVRLMAGVCETMALAQPPADQVIISAGPFGAKIFDRNGWRAEVYRHGALPFVRLYDRADADAFRSRLALL